MTFPPHEAGDASAPPAHWVIHCDGSAIPNPGRMGLGATLLAPDGRQHLLSLTSSLVGCNNEAELRALIAALAHAQALGAQAVTVFTDSSVLVEHLQPALPGRHAAAPGPSRPHAGPIAPTARATQVAPIARLAELLDSARQQLAAFANAQLQWIPRHRNSAADTLARAALGAPAKPAPHPSHRTRRKKR